MVQACSGASERVFLIRITSISCLRPAPRLLSRPMQMLMIVVRCWGNGCGGFLRVLEDNAVNTMLAMLGRKIGFDAKERKRK